MLAKQPVQGPKARCLMRAQGNGPPPDYAIQPVPNIPGRHVRVSCLVLASCTSAMTGGQLGSVQNYFLMFREETVRAS